jgi:hypothetical protein
VLIAKWVPGKSPEPELLLKSVTECGVALAECGDDYAKIMLNAKQDAPDVIAGLVKSGIPIEEIYFDRRGLSELFKPESDRRVPKDQSDATQQATKP